MGGGRGETLYKVVPLEFGQMVLCHLSYPMCSQVSVCNQHKDDQ
jgi:hypothetical protein